MKASKGFLGAFLWACCFSLLLHSNVAATTTNANKILGMEFKSSKITWNSKNKSLKILDPKFYYKDFVIFSEEALLDIENKVLSSSKGLTITGAKGLRGSSKKITFTLKDKAVLEGATIYANTSIFTGEKISLEENLITLEEASFTPCSQCDPPPWSLNSSLITMNTLTETLEVSTPSLRVAKVPIFLLPSLRIPLGNKSSSGLLAPEIDYHSRSLILSLRHYLSFSPASELTSSLMLYHNRGEGLKFHYRNKTNKDSLLETKLLYFKDEHYVDETRGLAEYRYSYIHPQSWYHHMHYTHLSDLDYYLDFPKEADLLGESHLKNFFSFTKTSHRQLISGKVEKHTSLLHEEDESLMLPQMEFHYFTQFKPFLFEFQLDYQYRDYSRDLLYKPAYDIISFAELPNLHRVSQVLSAYNYLPIYKGVTLSNTLSSTTNYYLFPHLQKKEEQDTYRSSLDYETALSINFEKESSYKNRFYREVITPTLSFVATKNVIPSAHPFLEDDFEKSQIWTPINDSSIHSDNISVFSDYVDAVAEHNTIDFKVKYQKFVKDKGTQSIHNAAYTELSQSYDFSNKETPWSPLYADLTLQQNSSKLLISGEYDHYPQILNYLGQFQYFISPRYNVTLGHATHTNINNKREAESTSKKITYTLGGGLSFRNAVFNSNVQYSDPNSEFVSWHYDLTFKDSTDCWGLTLSQTHILGQNNIYSLSFRFNL